MKVRIKFFASLRRLKGQDTVHIECPNQTTVGQLLENQGLSREDAPVILVNGVRVDYTHILADGDVVSAFPLIGGG